MQAKRRQRQSRIEETRYEWLCQWLSARGIAHHEGGATFQQLRDWLLENGAVQHVRMSRSESEPFVAGTDFYGETFEAVVDSERGTKP